MSNISARILCLALERGDKVAFRMQKEEGGYRVITWREYYDRTLRLATFLQKHGVGPGERVLLISENCPEWTMAAVAVMCLGATLVPVAAIASSLEAENVIRGSKPKFCIFSSRASNLKNLDSKLLEHFLYWDSQEENPLEDICRENEPHPLSLEYPPAESAAILIYTSGTTGQPKAVPLTHKNILSNAEDVLQAISASDKDRCVSVLPLSHMLEFTGGFLVASIVGAEVTYIKSLKPEDLLQALKDTRATILIAVPLLFEVMARNLSAKIQALPKWLQKVFKSFSVLVRKNRALGPILFFPMHRALGGQIRFFMAGGARLQPHIYEFFRDLGILVLQGYGLTETSPVLSVTSPKEAGADHVGKALARVELGIFDEQGMKMPGGREGEVWARGPNVFSGYLDPQHNEGVFERGWFKTGDLGTLDDKGFLRITGRKRDIIVTGSGKNVYPEEIESFLLQTGFFLEAAALGYIEGGSERVCVAAVPDKSKFLKAFAIQDAQDLETSSQRVINEALKVLSDYKWPQRIEIFFEELPKTVTRKIKKHEVRALIKRRDLEKQTIATPAERIKVHESFLRMEDDLERTIAESISQITRIPQQEIARSASLTQTLNLDSLLVVEVIGAVEKKFSHQFESVDFSKVDTVADLLAVLGQALGDKRKSKRWSRIWLAEFHARDNQHFWWRGPRTLINWLLKIWLRSAYQMRVEGVENLGEATDSIVLTPNHCSHFDTLAVMAALPQSRIHTTYAVAAKDYFFSAWWKAFLARILINGIPFDRKARVDESMEKCRDILVRHGSLLIFPEGTRSPNGQLQEFKSGVGQLLAAQKRVKAVPVFIKGAFEILPKGRGVPLPAGFLLVRFGKPISFMDSPPTKESYKSIAKKLQQEVAILGLDQKKGL